MTFIVTSEKQRNRPHNKVKVSTKYTQLGRLFRPQIYLRDFR